MNLHLLFGDTLREFIDHAFEDDRDRPMVVIYADILPYQEVQVSPHHELVSVAVTTGHASLRTYIRQAQPELAS